MLCPIYIEALLVNEELADLVWEAWNADKLCDVGAAMAWLSMLRTSSREH